MAACISSNLTPTLVSTHRMSTPLSEQTEASNQLQRRSTERTFISPRNAGLGSDSNVPTLDEFDMEIDIYRVS